MILQSKVGWIGKCGTEDWRADCEVICWFLLCGGWCPNLWVVQGTTYVQPIKVSCQNIESDQASILKYEFSEI